MKKCPKCGGRTFDVVTHVTQGWLVDENGEFVSCTEECIDILHRPDDQDIWTCLSCGFEAAGQDFNIKTEKIDSLKHPTYKDIYRMLHDTGGCGATSDFDKGWDSAIDSVIDQFEKMTGLDANCLDDDA